jgi:ubiquinone/menaquinone biosynthesis C-methylase UbiE
MLRRVAIAGGVAAGLGLVACQCCRPLPPALASEAIVTPKPTLYQRYFSSAMARFSPQYEAMVANLKKDLFAELGRCLQAGSSDSGEGPATEPKCVLEVGIGSGPNLSYLVAQLPAPGQLHVTGLDPNPAFQQYAREVQEDKDVHFEVVTV